MEENYEEITRIFPYEDVKGRRLMPVFLFRTPDQYYDYYAAIANQSREHVSKSKGHAWRDYYATWYEAPGDPVHIHECTHQIFKNRLRLNGGGSWFQEGMAEYIETKENERNAVRMSTADGHEIAFVQIAGLVARRIVSDLYEGQSVLAGERFGLIRFGSRVDVYLDDDHVPLVLVGQKAVAGETVLADTRGPRPERREEER